MRFIVKGARPLKGDITVSGSKNAALPIIAATLLSEEEFTISNIPDIQDVRTLLEIMRHLGSQFTFDDNTLKICTPAIRTTDIPKEMVKTMRASILLVGPLLARAKQIRIGYPGGCVLGKRPVDTHLDALRELGVRVREDGDMIFLDSGDAKAGKVILKEISVTATENLLMFASGLTEETEIRLAAQEPHVQDLCRFLIAMGVFVNGVGTHVVTVRGGGVLRGTEHRVVSDYLEVGTMAIAAAATCGDVTIHDVHRHDLDALWQKMCEAGIIIDFDKEHQVRVRGVKSMDSIAKVDTGIFPKFPTDLQAPFMVMLTQANGVSKVFETLFEGRLNYLFELEKLGARFEFLNPHQAIILGPTPLYGAPIASCDIRAGAGMIIAALIAEGTTEVSNINYIDRGYEALDEKFRQLGAYIVRSQSPEDLPNEQRSLHQMEDRERSGELRPEVPVSF
ncbi:MAG: UDP-N-acetylglucosamine 1-carboxyvinyltransferase [bacterium]|nr:UDP-N-acetylglucosamine 1-carboxyvinyltransferase [bacterium]